MFKITLILLLLSLLGFSQATGQHRSWGSTGEYRTVAPSVYSSSMTYRTVYVPRYSVSPFWISRAANPYYWYPGPLYQQDCEVLDRYWETTKEIMDESSREELKNFLPYLKKGVIDISDIPYGKEDFIRLGFNTKELEFLNNGE